MNLCAKENIERVICRNAPAYIPFGMETCIWTQHNDSLFFRQNGDQNLYEWKDPWGVDFAVSDKNFLDSAYPVTHPMNSVDEIDTLKVPPINDELFHNMKKTIDEVNKKEHLIIAVNPALLFVRCWLLIGMENFLIELITHKTKVAELMDIITEYQISIAKKTVELDVDIVTLNDDVATNLSLYVNPELWREMVKPRLKKIISIYKDAGCYLMFHCCGHVIDIIDDIIELGFDILNPVQASANNFHELIKKTAGKITLYGGINADTIMRSTPENIARMTYETLHILGKDGGYIAFADQELPFPKANLAVVEQIVKAEGKYPLVKDPSWKVKGLTGELFTENISFMGGRA